MTAPEQLATQRGTGATDWMQDDSNFLPGSPAEQATFNIREGQAQPFDSGERPAAPITLAPEEGLTEAHPADKTAREAIEEQLGQAPQFTQDEKGKWHRPDGSFATNAEVAKLEAKAAEGGTEEDRAAAAKALEKPSALGSKVKQPIGDVAIYDAEGNEVEFPEMAVTFKAGERVLEKVPLDKLIRQAQNGAYNEQRERESIAARNEAEASRSRIADMEAQIQQMEQFYHRVATDDQFINAFRAQYNQQNTPEALLAQKDAQIQAIQQQYQQKEQQQQVDGYVQREIAPKLNALLAQLPADDELLQTAFQGKTASLTQHLMVNGKVPPQRLPEVARLIDAVLTPWVDAVTQGRKTSETKEKQELEQKLEATKIALTLAKKAQARAIAPQGVSGGTRERPKPLPPPKSAEEANQRLFAQLEQQYGPTR